MVKYPFCEGILIKKLRECPKMAFKEGGAAVTKCAIAAHVQQNSYFLHTCRPAGQTLRIKRMEMQRRYNRMKMRARLQHFS